MKERKARCDFVGQDIRVSSACGSFNTMNPRYAARCELPDNLKALLRPVSVMVPDFALIAEIMIFSEGFSIAKVDPHMLLPAVHHMPAMQLFFGASAAMCCTCPPLEPCLC